MTVTEKSETEANFERYLGNSKCVFTVFHPFDIGESL